MKVNKQKDMQTSTFLVANLMKIFQLGRFFRIVDIDNRNLNKFRLLDFCALKPILVHHYQTP